MNFWRPPTQKETQAEWNALTPQERMVQIARYFADDVKVREYGINRGFWVERFLGAVGLGGGYAWCAAFVTYCFVLARCENPAQVNGKIRTWRKIELLPKNPASVKSWHDWGLLSRVRSPKNLIRGDFFGWLNKRNGQFTGTGHIEIVVRIDQSDTGYEISTIGGNTDLAGSREGDGVYRSTRRWSDSAKREHFGVRW